jgi:hypothetical protein
METIYCDGAHFLALCRGPMENRCPSRVGGPKDASVSGDPSYQLPFSANCSGRRDRHPTRTAVPCPSLLVRLFAGPLIVRDRPTRPGQRFSGRVLKKGSRRRAAEARASTRSRHYPPKVSAGSRQTALGRGLWIKGRCSGGPRTAAREGISCSAPCLYLDLRRSQKTAGRAAAGEPENQSGRRVTGNARCSPEAFARR